jgi:hypothetical protein
MKYFALLLIGLALSCRPATDPVYAPLHTINPVIGDASWIAAHGEAPAGRCDEQERIQCHLLYAADLLSASPSEHLSATQRANRLHLMDLLRGYAQAGVFPDNFDVEGGRRPCFIDDEGKICAVGYLVEQTLGREVAEAINDQFQYATIGEMDLDFLREWMSEYGVTLRDLATIQPTYEYNFRVYYRPAYYAQSGFSLRGVESGYPTWTVGTIGNFKKNYPLIRRFTTYDLSLRRESLGGIDHLTHFNFQIARTFFKKLGFRFGAGVGWYEVRADEGLAIKPQCSAAWPIVNLTQRMRLSFQLGYGYDIIPSRNDVPGHSNHDVFAGLRLAVSPF